MEPAFVDVESPGKDVALVEAWEDGLIVFVGIRLVAKFVAEFLQRGVLRVIEKVRNDTHRIRRKADSQFRETLLIAENDLRRGPLCRYEMSLMLTESVLFQFHPGGMRIPSVASFVPPRMYRSRWLTV